MGKIVKINDHCKINATKYFGAGNEPSDEEIKKYFMQNCEYDEVMLKVKKRRKKNE